MNEDTNTNNAFAIVLGFYYSYKRDILVNETNNLHKIAIKYNKIPNQLLVDLEKKYNYKIPNRISLYFVQKLITLYQIPISYRQLLPSLTLNTNYDERYDIYSDQFDPLLVLNNKIIICQVYDNIFSDNISRLRNIVPGNNLCGSLTTPMETIHKRIEAKEKVEKDLPLLKSIPLNALSEKTGGRNGPFSMLLDCINEKCRVRILIRRLKGVKAILYGYIKAFDRHWNLLMNDVDEVYVPLSSKKKFPLTQLFQINLLNINRQIYSHGVMKRYLPQLLVRGDNIIVISKIS